MKNSKHTPGPKDCDLIRAIDGGYKIINPDTWEDIAVVYDKDKLPLLAAAPELLAALEEVRDMLESSSPTEKRKEDIHFLVVAALMKAKGDK
jgi:argininosuccinate lyase